MQFVIEKLLNFNGKVFRNIKTPQNESSVFDDLSKNTSAKKYAFELSLSEAEKSNFTSTQYHAIEHIFLEKKGKPSRFSDGSYPSWYGSTRLETTFHETAYHWHRTFIQAPIGFSDYDQPIPERRRIYTVSCNATLIDLRHKHAQYPELSDPDIHSYTQTQLIGEHIRNQGLPGLITLSCRHKSGENIAIFRQEFLSNPNHQQDFLYTFNPKDSKIIISEFDSNHEIMQISVLNCS